MKKHINKKLIHIYNLMYDKVGPRNWWPAETDLEMIVGAILTQFVSWKNVECAVKNLKDRGVLSIEGICSIDDAELEELIRCTRFYKQKARKLKEFCRHIMDNYGGSLEKLFEKDIAELRKELLSLYGIGEETADCIILYAAKKSIFVVDAYTRRVYSRLGFFKEDISYKDMQEFFMKNLSPDVQFFNEYHAQIDGIGAHYCDNKKPKCNECPIASVCRYKAETRD